MMTIAWRAFCALHVAKSGGESVIKSRAAPVKASLDNGRKRALVGSDLLERLDALGERHEENQGRS
jgi:hypothetical protein